MKVSSVIAYYFIFFRTPAPGMFLFLVLIVFTIDHLLLIKINYKRPTEIFTTINIKAH